MIKRYYPGANTPEGYISFFDKVISWPDANKIIILKGGPGLGKSTLMKNIAQSLEKNNIALELLHCTSDSSSLDGLILTDYNIAIFDGTAPHITDPKYPGCIDEIINLGKFYNKTDIKKHKKEIIYIRKKISKFYKMAYNYLKAAKIILDDLKDIYASAMNISYIRNLMQKIYDDVFKTSQSGKSNQRIRYMFASAITADGCVNHLNSLFGNVKNRYIIKGPNGAADKSILMESIFNFATKLNDFSVDVFLSPMDPVNIEHMFIYDLDCAFITLPNELDTKQDNDKIIDLNLYLSLNESQNEIIKYNNNIYDKLLNRAVELLNKAKLLHAQLESIYAANMNFKHVDDVTFHILKNINKSIELI